MPSTYDVVIVGAGPAGGAAAYHCAAAGLSTLLVDRKPFPRVKVCGDGLTPRALRALARMNLSSVTDGWPRIEGIRLVGARETGTLQFDDEPAPFDFGAVIPRRILDDEIRRTAEAAGAEFRDAVDVTDLGYDREGTVTGVWLRAATRRTWCAAPLTVLADGAHGRLSRQLQGEGATRNAHRGIALRQYLQDVVDLGPFFEVRPIALRDGSRLEGYAWIFPVGTGTANVGLGILNRSPAAERDSLSTLFADFVGALARTDPRFRRAEPAAPLEGGTLATAMTDPAALPRGVLCVGDAAGLVNPFTGEGIAAALESGELAARVAVATLTASGGPSYRRLLTRTYSTHWRLRASPRHLAWQLSLSPPGARTGSLGRVSPALRALALDRPSTPRPRIAPLVAAIDPVTATMIGRLRRRIGARLRRTDAVLAELGRRLCSPADSSALWPLVVAAQAVTGPVHDPLVQRGFLALALSSLARSILEDARDATDAAGDNSVAIMVGDCLLTEAAAVACRLPRSPYRRVVAASLDASRALLARSAAETIPLVGPRSAAETAAALALDCTDGGGAARGAILASVGWCAETIELLFRQDTSPSRGIADELRARVAVDVAGLDDLPRRLAAMLRRTREVARGSLAPPAAQQRSA
jgi:menaquinone-9 beta-reductase